MALTRANAEFLLEARVGTLLTAADLDGTTVDGTNVDLNDPIGRAVRACGYTVTSLVLVADADIAQITVSQYDEFLDVATYHVLEAILGNLDDVDITVGSRKEALGQLAAQAERKAERLWKRLERDYGYGLAIPEAGYITLNIAEHD